MKEGQYHIYFAALKKHLGLYPGGEATTVFADQLTDNDVGKGTICLPYDKSLSEELVADIARWCFLQDVN